MFSDEKFLDYFEEITEIPVFYVSSLSKEDPLSDFYYEVDKEKLVNIQNSTSEEDIALLMFTSGTTSKSKGVVIRNYNTMHSLESYRRGLGLTEADRGILPVPMYLITGLIAVFGLMMHVGGSVYLNRIFSAERILSDIQKYKITFFHASPTALTLLLEQQKKYPHLSSLKMLICGAGNIMPGKIKKIHQWLPECEFRTVYGLTETTSAGTTFPQDAATSQYIGSSGVATPGLEIMIADDNGKEVQTGEKGNIFLKGANIIKEYYKADFNTIKNGWLNTGDIGYVNQNGYLYIVDRKKDMINRGGEKICSFDVENEILNIDLVEDCAVVGIPHETYGETPAAIIKLRPKAVLTAEEVKSFLEPRLAGYKIPTHILFVDQIPLTDNMKVNKNEIKNLFKI